MINKILVTGAAGFIGFHLSKRLCEEGWDVTGLDNLNDYYDINLKLARLEQLTQYKNFKFIQVIFIFFLRIIFILNNKKIIFNYTHIFHIQNRE